MPTTTPIIVALDFPTLEQTLAFVDQLDPSHCRLKVGKELFTQVGPRILKELHNRHFEVFLDLKFHDIPNTTARAVSAAADHGVWMVNIHASGGLTMMQTAADALARYQTRPLLIGVTILTSMSEQDWQHIAPGTTIDEQIRRLAMSSAEAGLDGVVCSAHEAAMLKSHVATIQQDFITVTPGIRLADKVAHDDQQRVMTPEQAMHNGADYIVIGRPVTQATNPLKTLAAIQECLKAA